MTDNLRTRIANVLYAMDCDDYDIQAGEKLDPSVFWAIREGAERRADTLIRELGLRREDRDGAILRDGYGQTIRITPYRHRYVTEWTTDE